LAAVSTPVATPVPADAGARSTETRPVVTVRGVHKTFRIPHQNYSTLKERVLHPFASRTFDELRALDDVSLEVAAGECFGIVGRNGSGKSTLLKCLAGIYGVDAGEVSVTGRLSPFIELGVGFNPELTARDNVIINAIMLGLSRREARARFDEIIEFAGLEEFLDLRLKNYSSGMHVRLAFSVAIQVDAEILLVDEVLAVGDAAFQQKCFEQFHRMKAEGRTILFVTHDMAAVERFCDRAMLVERGRIVATGAPADIARRYNELNFGRLAHTETEGAGARFGDLGAELRRTWFEDGEGRRVPDCGQGELCVVCIEVAFNEAVVDPVFAVTLRNEAGHTVLILRSDRQRAPTGSFAAGDVVVIRMAFQNFIAPSRYAASPSVARPGGGADVLDAREDMASLIVHGSTAAGGVVDIPFELTLER